MAGFLTRYRLLEDQGWFTRRDALADRALRGALRSVMQHQELIGRQRELSVSLPVVVGEFNLVGTIQELNDGANLPAQEALRGHI